jgi:cell wall-associated NlpC family hydrolase
MTLRRLAVALGLALVAGCLAVLQLAGQSSAPEKRARPAAEQAPAEAEDDLKLRPRVAVAVGPGEAPPAEERSRGRGREEEEEEQPPADEAEIRRELRAFRRFLASADAPVGARARVLPDGTAVAPRNAPRVVRQIIAAGNEIATTPYRWGGGHGAWEDSGYDCSGSVSFALAGAGLLNRPMTSGQFVNWGDPGRGRWVTIYASPGHMFMVVAGLRFDTSGRASAGTRWQRGMRPTAGLAAVHPPGL